MNYYADLIMLVEKQVLSLERISAMAVFGYYCLVDSRTLFVFLSKHHGTHI